MDNQEAVRQHAIAALNLVQQAKQAVNEAGGTYTTNPNTTNPNTTHSGNSEAPKTLP